MFDVRVDAMAMEMDAQEIDAQDIDAMEMEREMDLDAHEAMFDFSPEVEAVLELQRQSLSRAMETNASYESYGRVPSGLRVPSVNVGYGAGSEGWYAHAQRGLGP